MPRYPVTVYNVGPFGENHRRMPALARELHGIASTHPKVIFLCETVGWGEMPELPGYRQFRNRDTPGRANITVYVHQGLQTDDGRWLPCRETWRMTRPGAGPNDRHPPREVFKLVIEQGPWLFGHDPPLTRFHDTGPARAEHLNLVSQQMAPWLRDDWDDRTPESRKRAKDRLRVYLADPNGQGDDLAKRVGGWFKGSNIEGGVVVGGHWVNARTQPIVGGVVMGSDHHRAFLSTVVDDR